MGDAAGEHAEAFQLLGLLHLLLDPVALLLDPFADRRGDEQVLDLARGGDHLGLILGLGLVHADDLIAIPLQKELGGPVAARDQAGPAGQAPASLVVEERVCTVSIGPTVLDLLGIESRTTSKAGP